MIIVEGAISVKACLQSKYRKVNKVIIDVNKDSKDFKYILSECQSKHITIEKSNREEIDKLASGKSHGGILAEVTERKMQNITSLLFKDKPLLAIIEGVEDGFNFGYMLRTLHAFGFDGVILNNHDYDYADMTLIKSSAGASELMPICNCDDIKTILEVLKKNNVKIVSAYRGQGAIDLYDYELKDSGYCFAIGGPLRGLSKVILDYSDDFVYIPYEKDFKNALNAASATSVIAWESYRQLRKIKKG